MAEVPRNKGNFIQPGMAVPVLQIGGFVVSHDGTLAPDTAYLQADYPVLFDLIGTTFNDPLKGDDGATQFRTPQAPDVSLGSNWTWRIRF